MSVSHPVTRQARPEVLLNTLHLCSMIKPSFDQNQCFHYVLPSVIYPGKEQVLKQNTLHDSAWDKFLGQLLSSLFQWQRYPYLITGHLQALHRETGANASHTSQNWCWHSVYTQTYIK